jgi:hypothetical protein
MSEVVRCDSARVQLQQIGRPSRHGNGRENEVEEHTALLLSSQADGRTVLDCEVALLG